MAVNTLRPPAPAPRQNTPRETAPPPAPEPVRGPEPEEQPEPKPARKPRRQSTWSIFSLVERVMSVDKLFSDGVPVRFLPHMLFGMLLILLYIGNTHYATRMNRSIQKLRVETDDLRADYTTLTADYMEASKQSEVARKVIAYGLVESSSPPFRITIPQGGLAQLTEEELAHMPLQNTDSLAYAASAPDSTALVEAEAAAAAGSAASHGAAPAARSAASNKTRTTQPKATGSKPTRAKTTAPKPAAKPARAGAKPAAKPTSKPSKATSAKPATSAKAKTGTKAATSSKPTTRH